MRQQAVALCVGLLGASCTIQVVAPTTYLKLVAVCWASGAAADSRKAQGLCGLLRRRRSFGPLRVRRRPGLAWKVPRRGPWLSLGDRAGTAPADSGPDVSELTGIFRYANTYPTAYSPCLFRGSAPR